MKLCSSSYWYSNNNNYYVSAHPSRWPLSFRINGDTSCWSSPLICEAGSFSISMNVCIYVWMRVVCVCVYVMCVCYVSMCLCMLGVCICLKKTLFLTSYIFLIAEFDWHSPRRRRRLLSIWVVTFISEENVAGNWWQTNFCASI